jgi:hypothetical protein
MSARPDQPSPAAELEATTNEAREAIEQNRANTVLVCVDNDPESHMILRLAEQAGISIVRSDQPLGATLDREPDVVGRVVKFNKGQTWIVEMPGPATENALRAAGQKVRIIDHHTYKDLDRATDPATGKRNPSSLEQFLDAAQISDDELRSWGHDPKTVRGLGIFDDRFAQGLRDAHYSPDELKRVLDLRLRFSIELNPSLAEINEAAEKDWEKRQEWNGYTLVVSDYPKDVRGAISTFTIYDNTDIKPLIVSAMKGTAIYVQHVDPKIVDHLRSVIHGNTFTFGAGRCWGVNNAGQSQRVSLGEVLNALETAPK